jgi:cell wall-associated NlpC family hydrolase
MSDDALRKALCDEALTWLDTPYRSVGKLKGVGVNCAMIFFLAGKASGVLAADVPEPSWYTPQFASNNKEERLINYLTSYGAAEIKKEDLGPGDVIAYKSGLSHGHLALVIDFPSILHVMPAHGCQMGLYNEGVLAKFSMRFFTFFHVDIPQPAAGTA